MSEHYQITVAELETLMREALAKAGFRPDYLERYVKAHKNFGWLRPNTPSDILAMAEIHYTIPPASGFGPVIPPAPVPKKRQR